VQEVGGGGRNGEARRMVRPGEGGVGRTSARAQNSATKSAPYGGGEPNQKTPTRAEGGERIWTGLDILWFQCQRTKKEEHEVCRETEEEARVHLNLEEEKKAGAHPENYNEGRKSSRTPGKKTCTRNRTLKRRQLDGEKKEAGEKSSRPGNALSREPSAQMTVRNRQAEARLARGKDRSLGVRVSYIRGASVPRKWPTC